jgi:hypothetical protein
MNRKLRQTLSGQSFRAKKLFVYGGYVNAAAREKQDGKEGVKRLIHRFIGSLNR